MLFQYTVYIFPFPFVAFGCLSLTTGPPMLNVDLDMVLNE
jgi:hypothetical protein